MHQKNVKNSLPTRMRSLSSHTMKEWKVGHSLYTRLTDDDSHNPRLDHHRFVPCRNPSRLPFIGVSAVPAQPAEMAPKSYCRATKTGGS